LLLEVVDPIWDVGAHVRLLAVLLCVEACGTL
jgi:hypothetical protein